jgi:hypothetical protein
MNINLVETSLGMFPDYMLHKDKSDMWHLSTPLGNFPINLVKEILEHEPFYWNEDTMNWVMIGRSIKVKDPVYSDKVNFAYLPVMHDLMESMLVRIKKDTNAPWTKCCTIMLNNIKKEKLKRGLIG